MYQATAVDIFVFVHVATKPGGFFSFVFFLILGHFQFLQDDHMFVPDLTRPKAHCSHNVKLTERNIHLQHYKTQSFNSSQHI